MFVSQSAMYKHKELGVKSTKDIPHATESFRVPEYRKAISSVYYMEEYIEDKYFPEDSMWYRKDRVLRTDIVYKAICEAGGWWGRGCPSEKQLVSWLVFEEGATLSEYDQTNMIKGIRYRLRYFVNNEEEFIRQLSAYTVFFNPNGDDVLSEEDWEQIVNPIGLKKYIDLVEKVYSDSIGINDGNYLYWWTDNEIVSPKGTWPGESNRDYFQTRSTNKVTFYFSGVPNVRTCATRGVNCR